MRWLRLLIYAGVVVVSIPIDSAAMGSGPHPNVPFGIPFSPTHGSPVAGGSGISTPALPIWVLPSLILAGMVIWSVPPRNKK